MMTVQPQAILLAPSQSVCKVDIMSKFILKFSEGTITNIPSGTGSPQKSSFIIRSDQLNTPQNFDGRFRSIIIDFTGDADRSTGIPNQLNVTVVETGEVFKFGTTLGVPLPQFVKLIMPLNVPSNFTILVELSINDGDAINCIDYANIFFSSRNMEPIFYQNSIVFP